MNTKAIHNIIKDRDMNGAFNKDKDGHWLWTYDFAVGYTAVFRGWPGRDNHTGIEVGEAFVVEDVRNGWIWSSKFPNSYQYGSQPNFHNNHMFLPMRVWRDMKFRELGI